CVCLRAKLCHGSYLDLSVPSDRDRGLDGGQVLPPPQVHRRQVHRRLGPHRRRGLLRPVGGDRAGEKDQTAAVGHGGAGEIQVRSGVRLCPVCPQRLKGGVSITRSYYRNSVGGLLVFDITNRRSFEHVRHWLEEAKMHVQPFQIIFLLVGHKSDLASQRKVSREEAEKLAAVSGMKYIETSAKDATNVEESFTILTREIYGLLKKGDIGIQEGWEGVKSGFVPNVVHSSEEAVKPGRKCLC
uniref:RAB39A, member RAS onco family n=1 Tax=Callorhinchus milii TaxID=7868 RepID=A0A4W3IGR7_CALMI